MIIITCIYKMCFFINLKIYIFLMDFIIKSFVTTIKVHIDVIVSFLKMVQGIIHSDIYSVLI